MRLVVNSKTSLCDAINSLTRTQKEHGYVRLTITTGKDRSHDQNALWFAMYTRISNTKGDGSALDIQYWRAFCKLRCGVPILQVYNDSFRSQWERLVLRNPAFQNWEAQINLMSDTMFGQDGFPVTRLMDTKQGKEYTESILRVFPDVYFDDLLDNKNESRKIRQSR
jgi:hypothetical protein